MKILYLFRDSYDSKYILSQLDQQKLVSAVILEKGTKAKKSKLRRIFARSLLLTYPMKVIDLAVLIMYSDIVLSRMKKKLGNYSYPQNKINLITDDANDEICMEFIKSYEPDILFIYGTAILKKTFLESVSCPVFNIHTGILPYYRNVHSDFWAYTKKDYVNIGVTVIYLDTGIDSGDIALQRKIAYTKDDTIVSIKVKNLELIPNLITSTIKLYKTKKLKKIRQNNEKRGFYPTPGFVDLLRLLKH